jgi:hypothetical protein
MERIVGVTEVDNGEDSRSYRGKKWIGQEDLHR